MIKEFSHADVQYSSRLLMQQTQFHKFVTGDCKKKRLWHENSRPEGAGLIPGACGVCGITAAMRRKKPWVIRKAGRSEAASKV